MQVSPRLMTAPTPPRPPEPAAAQFLSNVGKVGSAAQTVSGGLGAAERGYDWVANKLRGLSAPASEPYTGPAGGGYQREELPPVRAHGGQIRAGLAIGGMPFSEAKDEYVPEELSKPLMPQTLQAPKAPAPQQSGVGSVLGGLGDIGKAAEGAGKIGDFGEKVYDIGAKVVPYIAAMFLSRGGLVPRHGYADGGDTVVPEEWRPHLTEASRRYGVPEHILSAVARQESQYGRAAPDNPMQITEGTARNPGFGLSPISLEDRSRPEAFIPFAAQYISARNPNVNWEDRPASARALAATYNAGGDPNYAYNVGRYIPGMSQEDLAGLRVNTANEQPRQQAGLGAVQPEALPILQGLTTRRDPESKDFMQRNQDWIVPLLTGLGTMAASPSRYLGSAVLQGLGGGAVQYAGMQQRGEEQAIQREQVDVSRLREINQAMQMQEQMRQRLLESFGPRLEGNMYLNPYNGELVSAQQRMAIVNSMMSNMARQMGLPAMTGAEAAGGMPPGQRPGGETPVQPPSGGAAQPPAAAPGAAGPSGLVTPAAGAERPAAPDAAAASAGRGPDYSRAFTVDASSLPAYSNPNVLERDAAALLRRAETASRQGLYDLANNLSKEGNDKLRLANEIRTGARPVVDIHGNEFLGYAQAARDRRRFEEEQKKVEEEFSNFSSNGIRSYNSLENLTEIYQRPVELGGLSREKAAIASYLQGVLGAGNMPTQVQDLVTAAQNADKNAIELAFSKLNTSHMSRGTNMALQEMLAMVANPTLSARARYDIVTRSMAEISRDQAFYEAAMERDPRQSIGQFQSRWNANPENSLQRYIQNVRSRTTAFTGMSPEDVRASGAASAAIPRNLQGQAGIEYDRGLGLFRVPTGQQDASGRPTFNFFKYDGTPSQAPQSAQ